MPRKNDVQWRIHPSKNLGFNFSCRRSKKSMIKTSSAKFKPQVKADWPLSDQAHALVKQQPSTLKTMKERYWDKDITWIPQLWKPVEEALENCRGEWQTQEGGSSLSSLLYSSLFDNSLLFAVERVLLNSWMLSQAFLQASSYQHFM